MTLEELYLAGQLKGVKLTDWRYDSGDKRTSGSLGVTATVAGGTLDVEVSFGSSGAGDCDDYTVTFNDQEVELGDLDLPDFGAPHFNGGQRAVKRFEDNAEQELQEVLTEWLPESCD